MKTKKRYVAVNQPGKQVKPFDRNNFVNTLDFFLNTLHREQRPLIEQEFDDSLWRLDDDGNYPEVL